MRTHREVQLLVKQGWELWTAAMVPGPRVPCSTGLNSEGVTDCSGHTARGRGYRNPFSSQNGSRRRPLVTLTEEGGPRSERRTEMAAREWRRRWVFLPAPVRVAQGPSGDDSLIYRAPEGCPWPLRLPVGPNGKLGLIPRPSPWETAGSLWSPLQRGRGRRPLVLLRLWLWKSWLSSQW